MCATQWDTSEVAKQLVENQTILVEAVFDAVSTITAGLEKHRRWMEDAKQWENELRNMHSWMESIRMTIFNKSEERKREESKDHDQVA